MSHFCDWAMPGSRSSNNDAELSKSPRESGEDSEDESEILEESPGGRWAKRREEVSFIFYFHIRSINNVMHLRISLLLLWFWCDNRRSRSLTFIITIQRANNKQPEQQKHKYEKFQNESYLRIGSTVLMRRLDRKLFRSLFILPHSAMQ